jgi:hypothetical protein
MRLWTRIGTIGLAAAAVGCSTTDPSSSDPALNAVVAAMAAEGAGQQVEAMRGPGGMHGFGFRLDPARFDCTDGGREGLTVTRTCTFKDRDGTLQTAYDPATTESATQHVEVHGSFEREFMSATIDRVSDMTATGLAGAETSMTWNGSGTEKSTRARSSDLGNMEFSMNSAETITNVVIPVPRTESSWPLSGTITRHVTVAFTGGPRDGTTEDRTVTVTFNGTQMAAVTVNGETFQFDLATRGHMDRMGPGGPMGHRP